MLTVGEINGHRALWLENEVLKIAVLPEKGADIYEFIHRPSGVDFLMKTPSGLRPPGQEPPMDFLENYEGGWQELFPNTDAACEYRGVTLRFHGEVALLPWTYAVEREDSRETSVLLWVRCTKTQLRLERRMRLRGDRSILEVEEEVTNESDGPAEFVWGHHIVLGGDFVESGCVLDVPARDLITPEESDEPAVARLAPGQAERWPKARGRTYGEWIDLRYIPGPDERSNDDAYLTGLKVGRCSVSNPRKGLGFHLEWDAAVFRWVTLWQPYGGALSEPLRGTYGVGIEPWVSPFNLDQASIRGETIKLEPRARLKTILLARVADYRRMSQ